MLGASTVGNAALARELTLWSHWAAEQIKREFVEDAIRRFEAANPGLKIKASFYEKTALYAALETALRAGQGPGVFYAESDQVGYMESGLRAQRLQVTAARRSSSCRARAFTRR